MAVRRGGVTVNFAQYRARLERIGVTARQMGGAMRQVAQLVGNQARAEWVGLAKSGLDTTAVDYVNSIGPVEVKGRSNTTEFHIGFQPKTELIRGIEFGMRPFDLRKGFVGTNGSAVIHFATKFNSSGQSKGLAKKYAAHGVEHGAIFAKHDIQRALAGVRSNNLLGSAGPLFAVRGVTRESKLTRVSKSDLRAAGELLGNGRLHRHSRPDISVVPDSSGRPRFFRKTTPVKSWSDAPDRPAAGRLFSKGTVTKHAGGGGQIDTFRTISTKGGQGWIHPGLRARNFMRTVRLRLRKILQESMAVVREAWIRAIASGGQLDVTQLAAQLGERRAMASAPAIQIFNAKTTAAARQANRAASMAARFDTHVIHTSDAPALVREKRLVNRASMVNYKEKRAAHQAELAKQRPVLLGSGRYSHTGKGVQLGLSRYKQTLQKRRGERIQAIGMFSSLLAKQRGYVEKARAATAGSVEQRSALRRAGLVSKPLGLAERGLLKASKRTQSRQFNRANRLQETAYMQRRAEAARVRRAGGRPKPTVTTTSRPIVSAAAVSSAQRAVAPTAARTVMRRVAGAPRQQLGASEHRVLAEIEAKRRGEGQSFSAAPRSMSKIGGGGSVAGKGGRNRGGADDDD